MNEEHHILLYGLDGLPAMPSDAAAFRFAVESLIDDVRGHFGNEERAMRAFAFPDYERHRAEHERLLESVRIRLSRCSGMSSPGECAEIAGFLRGWLVRHMERDDARFAAFLACWEGAARA